MIRFKKTALALAALAFTATTYAQKPQRVYEQIYRSSYKVASDKKEDTGIDFKDELGNKGKKTNPQKTPTAKQDSTKTPAKPKRKEIDPDDEYYDLEGF